MATTFYDPPSGREENNQTKDKEKPKEGDQEGLKVFIKRRFMPIMNLMQVVRRRNNGKITPNMRQLISLRGCSHIMSAAGGANADHC